MTTGRGSLPSALRLRLYRSAAWALRVSNAPHFKPHWFYRLTLAILERRYQAAECVGGRELARTYDYIPF